MNGFLVFPSIDVETKTNARRPREASHRRRVKVFFSRCY